MNFLLIVFSRKTYYPSYTEPFSVSHIGVASYEALGHVPVLIDFGGGELTQWVGYPLIILIVVGCLIP